MVPKGSLKTDGLYGLWIFMMSKEFLIQGAIATSPNYFLMPCLPADEQLWQWPWCSPWASVSSAEQVDRNKCLRHIKRPLKIPDFFYWNLVEAPLWRQKYCMPKNNLAGCKSKIVKETGWTACQSHSFSVVQSRMCSLSGFDQSNLHSTGVSGPRYKKSVLTY